MKYLFLIAAPLVLVTCQVPLGDNGRYGRVYVGYDLPTETVIVSELPLYRGK